MSRKRHRVFLLTTVVSSCFHEWSMRCVVSVWSGDGGGRPVDCDDVLQLCRAVFVFASPRLITCCFGVVEIGGFVRYFGGRYGGPVNAGGKLAIPSYFSSLRLVPWFCEPILRFGYVAS